MALIIQIRCNIPSPRQFSAYKTKTPSNGTQHTAFNQAPSRALWYSQPAHWFCHCSSRSRNPYEYACFPMRRNCFVICTGQMFRLLGPIMIMAPVLNWSLLLLLSHNYTMLWWMMMPFIVRCCFVWRECVDGQETSPALRHSKYSMLMAVA